MNNIIAEKNKKRYLPHDVNTRKYAVEMYRNCGDMEYVCRKYHISRVSLWRWNKKYNGTKESLTDKSHRPNSKHPNSHTNQEIRWIRNYVRRNPRITLCELWAKLKREKGYTRTITALYRVMRRLNIKFYTGMNIKNTSKKKHNKKYNTPKNIGEKGQMDVKYVPNECKSSQIPEDKKFYQYTYIDEATRERYLYWYEEHTPANTVDFIYRVIKYLGYKPKEIQTDNGTEFTYNKANMNFHILKGDNNIYYLLSFRTSPKNSKNGEGIVTEINLNTKKTKEEVAARNWYAIIDKNNDHYGRE